jgi:dTDP-4-dehydrorhamnose reductase
MKKIYIAGSGGMLGHAFYHVFKENYILNCTDKDVNDNWLTYLDFRNYNDYLEDVLSFKPDYLFHLGAYTDLEFCEKNPNDTYLTNTISVESAVKISNKLNIPLLYISTAGIFDGSKEYFDDWDIPNPLGVYARSKFLAERYVIENSNEYLICRAGWMMGGGIHKDKKFIGKILKQINSGATVLNIVNDKDGTPTFTFDFAKNVKYLLENDQFGLYNLVCEGFTSRLEVAEKILEFINRKDITINVVDSTFFSKEYFAQRPPNERLLNYKLNLKNMNIMRPWDVALKDYLDNIFY